MGKYEAYRGYYLVFNLTKYSLYSSYSLRRDITKVMNNALLSYDEGILATLDRMKEMIENDIESDKLREAEINAK